MGDISTEIFSHMCDLTSYISDGDLVACFLVCRPWWNELQMNQTIWRRIVQIRWKIFKCPPSGRRLKEHMTRDDYVRLGRSIPTENPVFNLITNSVERSVTFGWSGFSNGHCGVGKSFVIRSFKEHGYDEKYSSDTEIVFMLANRGVWLYKRKPRNLLWCDDEANNSRRVYFCKLSCSFVDSELTHGWSGYNNGRAQKSIAAVVHDLSDRGYVIEEDTNAEIIFRKTDE